MRVQGLQSEPIRAIKKFYREKQKQAKKVFSSGSQKHLIPSTHADWDGNMLQWWVTFKEYIGSQSPAQHWATGMLGKLFYH